MIGLKSAVFRFSGLELRESELRLLRDGQPVTMEPKVFRVLVCLVRNASRLVTKEELLDAVWGDIAVTENSLTRAIALLRHILGDDPHNPRFIETVATAGYRFICPVETESRDAAASSLSAPAITKADTPAPQTEERGSRRMSWITLAASAVVLAGVACMAWYALRPLPTLRIASYTEIASVDRSTTATIGGTEGNNLYLNLIYPNGNAVVPVSGRQVVPLFIDLPTSKDSPGVSPLILDASPDGSRLLVGGKTDPLLGRELWIIDVHGRGARFLAWGDEAIWSPDGKTVLYSTWHGDLYTVPGEGGDARLLLASPAPAGTEFAVSNLAWSPDGSRIRFTRDLRYWEISADGRNPHEILPNWRSSNPRYWMCCGGWSPDGKVFVFLAARSFASQNLAEARQLWALDERRTWLHRAEPQPVELTNGGIIWQGPVFSRRGETIYDVGDVFKGQLVGYDSKSRQLLPYLGGISADFVDFSRDAKYVVFVSFPDGAMWRANRDGSGLQQLTGSALSPAIPKWSPDGTRIVFYSRGGPLASGIFVIPSQGGLPARLLHDDKADDMFPDWSPDGKKIVFDQRPVASVDVGGYPGRYQIWKSRVLDLATGKITDLPPCPRLCYFPQWSPDGRYILKLAADHKALLLLDLHTNRWSQLDPKLDGIAYPRWSRDGHKIYFQSGDYEQVSKSADPGIYRIPITGGSAEKVVDLEGFKNCGTLGVGWSGIDPDDRPLLLHEIGTHDVYALALERK